jgi:hypothetical protein
MIFCVIHTGQGMVVAGQNLAGGEKSGESKCPVAILTRR